MTQGMARTETEENILTRLERLAHRRPSKLALVDDAGNGLTYGEFWSACKTVARGLLGMGIMKGARIGLLGANSPDYLVMYFGVMKSGGVVVPLNNLLSAPEQAGQLALTGATLCICLDDVAMDSRKELGAISPVYRMGDIGRASAASVRSLPRLTNDDHAAVLMSSGSTAGGAKGVIHTHGSIMHATEQLVSHFPVSERDVTVAFLPFFTAIGEQINPMLAVGGTVLVLPDFDVSRICNACSRATTLDAIPTLMARLLNSGDHRALNSLRWLMFASEPMPPALLREWWHAIPDVDTYEFYGMTELLTITYATPETLGAAPDCVGTAFSSSRVWVVDEQGEELGAGKTGEIICASRSRMFGYFDDEAATRAVFVGSSAMRTGDLGYLDGRGRLSLCGRLKDVIISGGLNVLPSELEQVAITHPGVMTAAVVGIPDSRWGETAVVVAVPRPELELDAAHLLEFCRSRLSSYKRPSAAAVVGTLPRTGIGKVAKRKLQSLIEHGEIQLVWSR